MIGDSLQNDYQATVKLGPQALRLDRRQANPHGENRNIRSIRLRLSWNG